MVGIEEEGRNRKEPTDKNHLAGTGI